MKLLFRALQFYVFPITSHFCLVSAKYIGTILYFTFFLKFSFHFCVLTMEVYQVLESQN